jgi:leader peptidase (prepilin peptidase)/N-methyltransferase
MLVEAPEIRVDGAPAGGGTLVIRESEIVLPDGRVVAFADLKSLDGTASRVVAPREAMGRGDMHLLAMIGAFFGWTGVVFSLVAASFLGIAGALAGRIGLGRHLPFGPYLVLGAVAWMFGGWRLFAWYAGFLAPLFEAYPP